MKWLVFFFILFEFSEVRAQTNNELLITFSISQFEDAFELENLRFYISNVHLSKNNVILLEEKASYHLIDLTTDQNSFSVTTPKKLIFDAIHFDIGIDSLTNISGIYTGDLDPTKGMYWTWQSGYINFKLEGKHPKSNARNNAVQFHLGGYLPGQYSLQSLKFDCTPSPVLNIQFDIGAFLKTIDFSTSNTIMSPGVSAVKMSEQLATYFKLHE